MHEGQVVWLKLYSQETSIELIVIEEKPFQASITPPRADEMRAALDRDGRIALHVHFDFGIATLKADAGPVLEQIASLLEADADLRVSIEGHTDDIGNAAANRTLSRQRAQAVVDALVVGALPPTAARPVSVPTNRSPTPPPKGARNSGLAPYSLSRSRQPSGTPKARGRRTGRNP